MHLACPFFCWHKLIKVIMILKFFFNLRKGSWELSEGDTILISPMHTQLGASKCKISTIKLVGEASVIFECSGSVSGFSIFVICLQLRSRISGLYRSSYAICSSIFFNYRVWNCLRDLTDLDWFCRVNAKVLLSTRFTLLKRPKIIKGLQSGFHWVEADLNSGNPMKQQRF